MSLLPKLGKLESYWKDLKAYSSWCGCLRFDFPSWIFHKLESNHIFLHPYTLYNLDVCPHCNPSYNNTTMKNLVPHTFHSKSSFVFLQCIADEKSQLYKVDSKGEWNTMDVWPMHIVVFHNCSTTCILLFHHCTNDMLSSSEVNIVSWWRGGYGRCFDFPWKLGAKCMHIKIAFFTPIYPFTFLQWFLTKTTYRIGVVVVIILNEKMKNMIMEEYLHLLFHLYTMQMCNKFAGFTFIKIFIKTILAHVTYCILAIPTWDRSSSA
jgi:hypothetical protein